MAIVTNTITRYDATLSVREDLSDVIYNISPVDVPFQSNIGRDKAEFPLRYEPGHPAADPAGYVRTPNVNSMIEVMDMREAQRSYNANLSVMQVARGMIQRTIDLLK